MSGAGGPVAPRRRVVAIEVDCGPSAHPRWRYGSGLLIGGQQVLTAAHVVSGAEAIAIHRPDDDAPWNADVTAMLSGGVDVFDVAVLDVDEAEPLDDLPLARVNRDCDGDEVVRRCWAVGFPAFQRRNEGDGPLVRESIQVGGTIPPLSGLRSNLLTLQVTATPRPLPEASLDDDSEWAGMSGAAVFAGEWLLGVVTEHTPAQGSSAITVTPLDALLDPHRSPRHVSQWWRRLGVRDPGALPLVPEPASPAPDRPAQSSAAPAPRDPPARSDPPAAPAPEPSRAPQLADVIAGAWIVDVQTPMGQQTMRLELDQAGLRAVGIVGLAPGWQGWGSWMLLPGDRLAVQGMQGAPSSYPPQWPLQESFLFTAITPDTLEGRNSNGFPVTWRRG